MSVSSIGSSASSIDFSELCKKMADRMAGNMLKDLDSDGNGAISKSEIGMASQAAASSSSSGTSSTDSADSASLDEFFKAMDADGDGSGSTSKLFAFMEKAGPPQGPPPSGSPPPGPPPDVAKVDATKTSAASNTSSTSSNSHSADPADTNADGTVSTEERVGFAYQQLMAALQRLGETASKRGRFGIVNADSTFDQRVPPSHQRRSTFARRPAVLMTRTS